jgi:hypothetical protein
MSFVATPGVKGCQLSPALGAYGALLRTSPCPSTILTVSLEETSNVLLMAGPDDEEYVEEDVEVEES